MKVTAIKPVFIHGVYRRPGDKFECSEKEFSSIAMKKGEVTLDVIDNSKVKKAEEVKHVPLEIPSLVDMVKKEEKEEKPKKKPAKKKAAKKPTKKAD
jgi:hypothetical protein